MRREQFVVDPIDGTRGFIEGRDMWCVSVGVIENSRPVAGVLVCPAREQILKASSGAGAYLNDVQDKTYGTDEKFERHPHVPSLAYRIALVAMGQMTATFVKPNAHDWDIAAADIILHEAGGSLCDVDGENFLLNQENPKKSVMFATHPEFSKKMLAIVTETPFS
ncbi:Inositol-1-monophosphatase [Nymphon striatum]|nr:Inositol-1-monophosphatase [Nymphon striatum]